MMHIIIWDNDAGRIAEIDKNLHLALKELSLRAVVTINAEPPSIARANLFGRLPVLEIADHYWSLHPGNAFSKDQCISLLHRVLC